MARRYNPRALWVPPTKSRFWGWILWLEDGLPTLGERLTFLLVRRRDPFETVVVVLHRALWDDDVDFWSILRADAARVWRARHHARLGQHPLERAPPAR